MGANSPSSKPLTLKTCASTPILLLATMLTWGCARQPERQSENSLDSTPQRAVDTVPSNATQEFDYRDTILSPQQKELLSSNRSLRRLRLSGSNVDDATVLRIAELPQLEALDLVNCEAITPAALVAIGKIQTLRNLRLSGAIVNDQSIAQLVGLRQLAAILLQDTAVTDTGIQVLSGFVELKEVNLYKTPITDAALASFRPLIKLQKLVLRDTRITGENAGALGDLATVVELDLSETAFVNEGMPEVARMPSLRKLNLWMTHIDDHGLDSLRHKNDLTSLNLDNVSGITDQSINALAQLQSLTFLHLGGTSITAGGLHQLGNLDKLETLIITRLGLKTEEVELIRQQFPAIKRLDAD